MEPKTRPRPAEAGGETQSRLYQTIMTPINFVTFLLSLYLVDCHYHDKRMREHADRYSRLPTWLLPSWLRRLLFRPHPYRWVDRSGKSPPEGVGPGPGRGAEGGGREGERWYYHTKQKKLIKMEAADAFELRRTVLLALCGLALCAAWALWRLVLGAWAWYAG
ncbi:hypothetical protein AAE478_000984 [Parahypoxylon ruwenzoriense]